MKKELNKSPLVILFLIVFIDLVGFGIVIPILPYFASQYGANAFTLGALMAIYSGLQFFFSPLWGSISDRVGRRPVLLCTMVGTILSMCVLGFAHDLIWIFIGRAVAGISAANISTANAYIADCTTAENRAKGMGMIGAAFGLGFIFGPAIGGVLSRYGYSTPMLFAAALGLLNLIFAYFKLPEPPTTATTRSQNRSKRFDVTAFKNTMADPRTKLATVSNFIVVLAITQMEVVFALFMMNRFGFDAQAAGWLLAYMGILMVVIQGGLIGKLSKRFGEQKLIIAGVGLMALSLVSFAFSMQMWQVFFSLGALAIGNGIVNPSLSSLASLGSAANKYGATMGVYQSAGSFARVIGPISAGFLYDRLGIQIPFLLAALLSLVVLVQNLLFFLTKKEMKSWFKEARLVLKEQGFKGVVRVYGWKLIACVFMYYLIRDITLYIVIPTLVAKGIISLR